VGDFTAGGMRPVRGQPAFVNKGKAENGKSKDSDVQQRETVIGCKQSLERDSQVPPGADPVKGYVLRQF